MIACTLMTCHVYPIKPFKLVFLGSLPLQRGKKPSSIALCGAVRDGPETRQGGEQAAREDLGCGVTEYRWTMRALRQPQMGQLLLRASPVPGKLPAMVVAASYGLLGLTHLSLPWLSPLALQTVLGQMDQYFSSDFRRLQALEFCHGGLPNPAQSTLSFLHHLGRPWVKIQGFSLWHGVFFPSLVCSFLAPVGD